MSLADFHFLRPWWLVALLPVGTVVWLMIKKRLGSRSWEMVCDEILLPHILTGLSGRRRSIAALLTGLGGLLAVLALSGPAWEKLPQPVFTRESSLVIALDLSRSMDADDITPSRLLRARFKIADILQQRTDGQTALLVYAGDSFTVTPLTDDTATIISQLKALSPDIMPVQGNNTLRALKQAEELLKNAGAGEGDILFITDEIGDDGTVEYAAGLYDQGYRVSVLGVGTLQGVPIPLMDGSFLKDNEGKIVVPTLEEGRMQDLARAGGGIYHRVDLADGDVSQLLEFIDAHSREGDIETTDLETDTWREQGPWLLLALLPLTALMFRRGYILVLALLLLHPGSDVYAVSWDDLWLRPDQQAGRAFDQGDPGRAAGLFRDPAWKGAAQYRAGDFEGAVDSLQQAEDPENLYNLGNALARLGKYQEAISAYNRVLEQTPDHADALYNRELLQKELDKQQQRQDNPQQGQQDQDQQQDQDPDRDQEQQQSQQSEGDSQESDQQQQQQSADSQQGDQNQDDDNSQQSDEQQQQQQEEERRRQQQAQADQEDGEEQQEPLAQSDVTPADEDSQATEQWLRRIPDDPAGLLRRKFRYQYQQRGNVPGNSDKSW